MDELPLAVFLVQHARMPERNICAVRQVEQRPIGEPADIALAVRVYIPRYDGNATALLLYLRPEHRGYLRIIGPPLVRVGADNDDALAMRYRPAATSPGDIAS